MQKNKRSFKRLVTQWIATLCDSSSGRKYWIWILITAIAPFMLALFLQHGIGVAPCVLCVYQRVTLLGIAIAAIIVLAAFQNHICFLFARLLWWINATWGVTLVWDQLFFQEHRVCAIRPRFPLYFPLDEWFPMLFQAYASCNEYGLNKWSAWVPACMLVLFIGHFLLSTLTLFAYCLVRSK